MLFCELGEADRLGHALALGIDPTVWCERQGDMLLGISEHLDNLVWAWHHAVEIGELQDAPAETTALARKVVSRFEQRIEAAAQHVSWAKGNFGDAGRARTLYQAWLYRMNCPIQFQQYRDSQQLPDAKVVAAVPDLTELLSTQQPAATGLQGQKANAMTAQRVYHDRNKRLLASSPPEITVLLRPGNDAEPQFNEHLKFFTDYDNDDELNFMHALQDHLLEKYRNKKIVIETNPTSNLYVARLGSYREHPIYRWAPADAKLLASGGRYNLYGLRHGPMAVTINTDDPGIMPTTLRTEFLLIAEAGGLPPNARQPGGWLDEIRQTANTLFEGNRVSVWTDSGMLSLSQNNH